MNVLVGDLWVAKGKAEVVFWVHERGKHRRAGAAVLMEIKITVMSWYLVPEPRVLQPSQRNSLLS